VIIMHMTHIKLKDGREFHSYILMFRPERGWLSLMQLDYDDDVLPNKIYFRDMVSAIRDQDRYKDHKTGEWEIGDIDVIQEARDNGWDGN
jgi:hypothetical protein